MPQYWDSTKIAALKKCPAYFEYTINGRYIAKQESVHLLFGAAFHHAFSIYYAAGDREANLREAVRYLLGVELPPDNNKNTFTLVRSFVWYTEEYASDDLFYLPNGDPAIEVSFEFDINDEIVFAGHLDKIIRQDGDLYVVDPKTSKTTLTQYFFRNFEMSDQMAMYSYVAKHILGSPIRGVIIDGVQVAVGFTAFARSTVTYSLERLEEWLDDTLWHIKQHDSRDKIRHRWTSCSMYGGCSMRSVCVQSPSLRPNYLAGDFDKIEPWQPEKKR